VDDHVSKLEHMGKETVKKLQDIRGAAIGSGIDISVPTNCINKGASQMLQFQEAVRQQATFNLLQANLKFTM